MTNLAAGKTAPEAAAEAGVSERTVYRRMEQPEFRQSVLELRGRMMDDVAGRFAEAAGAAFERLHSLLGAENEFVQLGAARTILEQMIRLRDFVEFESRLRRVEEQCDSSQNSCQNS